MIDVMAPVPVPLEEIAAAHQAISHHLGAIPHHSFLPPEQMGAAVAGASGLDEALNGAAAQLDEQIRAGHQQAVPLGVAVFLGPPPTPVAPIHQLVAQVDQLLPGLGRQQRGQSVVIEVGPIGQVEGIRGDAPTVPMDGRRPGIHRSRHRPC